MTLLRWSRRSRVLKIFIFCAAVVCIVFLLQQYAFIHREHGYEMVTLSPRFRQSWSLERRNSTGRSWTTCNLPELNPFNPEVMRHFKNETPVDCSKAMDNWVYTRDGEFHITSSARTQHGDINCKYIPIVRQSDFAFSEGSPIQPMVDGAKLTSDFFKVECVSGGDKKYVNIHSGVARKEEIFKRLESFRQEKQSSTSNPADDKGLPRPSQNLNLDVFMFGFDSVSRMSWLRNFPLTRQYFVHRMGGVELEGYNIVGDGTPAALLPILTGHTEVELPEARRNHAGAQTVDGHPWLWKDFKRHGYVTAHAEDSTGAGTFQYRMLGFKDPPADHYMRTFYLAAEPQYKHHPAFCLGSVPRHVNFMNWFRELFSAYRGYPKIFFGFHTELSHGYFTKPQVMDQDLLTFITDLEKDGHLDNTLLILMADHGARFNHIREIPQGKLEERNPYFAFRFPPWFLRQYPGIEKNLKVNTRRLTTPFDIHATLLDLLNYTAHDNRHLSAADSGRARFSRGMSLLKEIPDERTCSDGGVTPHWCACLDWQPLNQSDEWVVKAVQAAVDKINSITQEKRGLCTELKLREITRGLLYVPTENDISAEKVMEDFQASDPMKTGLLVDKFLPPLLASKRELYQVSFITEPGQGHFEVTCTFDITSGKISINVNDISRMNRYGSAPDCLKDAHPQMNPYCYCK